jgi:hypothetical protein
MCAVISGLVTGDKGLNRGLELLNRFTKCEIRSISNEESVALFASTLDAALLVPHGVVGGMPRTSAFDAIHNPKRNLEHAAPLARIEQYHT